MSLSIIIPTFNNVNYLGAKLYSNPGRGSIARGKVLEVDVV